MKPRAVGEEALHSLARRVLLKICSVDQDEDFRFVSNFGLRFIVTVFDTFRTLFGNISREGGTYTGGLRLGPQWEHVW